LGPQSVVQVEWVPKARETAKALIATVATTRMSTSPPIIMARGTFTLLRPGNAPGCATRYP
jgi:hypothetical protein